MQLSSLLCGTGNGFIVLLSVSLLILSSFIKTVSASLFDDVLQALESLVDCASCHAALVPLQTLAFQGDDAFDTVFIEICDALQLEDPDVCQGTFTSIGPIIAHDLRSISVTGETAGRLCDALFGFCSSNVSTPFTVPLPPPKASAPTPSGPPSKRREPFQVVHISDVHIDRQYTVGAEANCTKNICCRNFPDQAGHNITEPAEPNGNHNCDSPTSLADSMLEVVNDINPKFIIFTGDVVEGATWLVDQPEVTNDLEDFNAQLLLKVKTRIFPSLGTDSAPVNAFARKTSMTANDSQWVFDTQAAGWEQWIGRQGSEEVQHDSGSYAAPVPGTNLVILSINTQYWYKQNFWLYDSDEFQPDPNGILAFMVDQLQAAENAGQKAWIIGHIPLGKEDTMEDQSNYYDQVLQRYKDTIVGHFFGHSHKDQFEIAYSNYEEQTAANAVSVALIGPALTPTSGNPAFKVYDVDPDTFGVMNMRVIFTNTSDPSFQIEPKWELFYDARQTYGPLVGLPDNSELTPAFWHNLTEVFERNDTAFQLYNTFLTRGVLVVPCDEDCKATTICDQRAFRSENNCDTPTGGAVSIGRRDIDDASSLPLKEDDECEGSRIRSLLLEMRAKAQGR
ncbi:sphingomyelin phosphodiesterase [Dendrothele bispora CBS 962.96]|uniref:Sphingomyelin phosphodiesterase n=1 Tax=Dendrothele bispora (strain CBS 962.96) TaxID=1314807 RepID=A0A4S8MFA3_DENBC|nr:sphingomyelin phosphodiesterase [Dendrothele bispora CBS 962.96]